MTEYKVFVKDFVERTLHNLEFLEKKHKSGQYEVYEFTQLVNSLLGLLVIPQQLKGSQIDNKFIDNQILKKLQGAITKDEYALVGPPHDSFEQILYHMRNAIAHGKLKMGAIDGDISTIEFKDRNKRTKQLFIIRLDIDLLREFVEDFAYKLLKII